MTRPDPSQRLTAEELAELAGFELEANEPQLSGSEDGESGPQFTAQLRELQADEVAAGVQVVLDAWVDLGGRLGYGQGQDASCFLVATQESRGLWPCAIYPSGKVEIVFQHLTSRPPFDDVELREEFRSRLVSIPEIELPASKIELRPAFAIEVLGEKTQRDEFIEHLGWFMQQHRRHLIAEAESERFVLG